jgi:cytidylate kinase
VLSRRYGYTHIEVDDYFWEPTDPPYQRMREVDERRRLLAEALALHPRWALAGSLCGWGDVFIPRFELVVFLHLPAATRMARLARREELRYGAEALAPEGKRHAPYQAFMRWAESYDTGDLSIRSLMLHQQWLSALSCPVIRLEGELTSDEQLDRLDRFVSEK